MTTPSRPKTLRVPPRFERIFLEKVWGGRRLERAIGIALPGTGPLGETWEFVDRADCVSSGAQKGASMRRHAAVKGNS